MHFKMSSAICFDLDQSKILSSGIGLKALCFVLYQNACFVFSVYKIILGTLENESVADVEWVYRPYMNTAKKQRFLSKDEAD